MKNFSHSIFLTILLCMFGANVSAHDVEVKNADGVTIYYKRINNDTELEVTFKGDFADSYSNDYMGNIVIPSEVICQTSSWPYPLRTYKVTGIRDAAFYECSGLTSITIPNSVTNIGERAFWNCSGLTSVTIPYSVTGIGDYAFRNCSGLTSVTIPYSVTNIGINPFRECSGLTSVTVDSNNTKYDSRENCNAIIETATNNLIVGCKNTIIPNTVTSIGRGAFFGFSSFTSVTIPNSVTSIDNQAFQNCYGLTSITIPNSVTSIGGQAFDSTPWYYNQPDGLIYAGKVAYRYKGWMPSNTSISIKDGTMGIAGHAFSGCSGLTSITIPNSVTSIESRVFYCENLATVVSLIENPFEIHSYVFSQNTRMNATLYVPKGTIEKYKATGGWKDFKNIVEGTPTGVTNITLDKETTNAPIYDLNGRRLTEPQKGINIIGRKKVLNH